MKIKNFSAVIGGVCGLLFVLNAFSAQSPSIITQPASLTVYETQPASFSVAATGDAPLSYQWYYNGGEIDYATNSTYTITLVRPSHAGSYFVVVSNPSGSVTSQVATLTVNPIPNCQPSSYSFGTVVLSTRLLAAGINAKVYDSDGVTPLQGIGYSAQLYGGPAGTPEDQLQPACPMTVFRTGTAAGYVIQTDVYIPGVMPGENATLQLRVWDNQTTTIQSYEAALAARVKTGKSAPITINGLGGDPGTGMPPIFSPYLTNIQSFIIGIAPQIAVHPQSQAVATGAAVTLSVIADGEPAPAYQWRKNGIDLQGANSATLLIPSFQPEDAGAYDVVVSNPLGSVTSQVATLSLLIPPSIEQGLADVVVDEGDNVQFEVIASGAQPLSYFWYKDNVLIGGATTPSLQLQSVQESAQGIYRVVVSNLAGVAQSLATLTVNQKPVANSALISLPKNSSKSIVLTGADADGDSLTFAIATPPQHGTLSGTPPNLTYTPQTDYVGSDSFIFTVNDGRLTSLPATINISVTEIVQNQPPVAQNLSLTNGEDMPLIIELPATDPNDDPLTFFIVSLPTNGVATLLSNNIVLYQPDTNFVGVDSFTFAAADSEFTSEVAVVSITITNTYDSISTVQLAKSTIEDSLTSLEFDLASAVVNPDGAQLTFSLPSAQSLRGGQISIVNNKLQYLPPPNFNGMDFIEYTVSDGVTSITGQLLVNVQYVNDVRPYPFNQAVNFAAGMDNPIAVIIGDYVKDNKPDVVVINKTGGISSVNVLVGDGKGSFDSNLVMNWVWDYNYVAAIGGDFNKDSNLDVVVVSENGDVYVMYGYGAGQFPNVVPARNFAAPATSITSADFNKDGRPDLAVGFSDGTVRILINNVSGWTDGQVINVGGVVSAVGAGDVYKTLKQALIVADSANNKVVVIPGDGKGGFSNAVAVAYDVGQSPVGVAVGDVNNDKLLDLVVVNGGSDDITVLTNKGKGVLELAGTFGVGESIGALPRGIVLGDFNRDKNLDVA
ncbi:MAG: immunoglobulin domain-containing protein, partial [Verrucomicrobiia bacterium]